MLKTKPSLVWLCMLTFYLAACSFTPWQKNTSSKTPEERIAEATKAAQDNVGDIAARKDLLVTKELAVTQMLREAERAQANAAYDDAIVLYDKVLQFLPDDQTAISGKAEVVRKLELQKKVDEAVALSSTHQLPQAKQLVREVLLEHPQQSKAVALQKTINSTTARVEPPTLKPPFEKPVTLELRDANIKVVFEALSRATGINFILDKDIRPDTKATIFIKKARIEDAIDMVLSSNGLQKKALSENTALVYPFSAAKLKAYQDLVIRSFYLSNASAKQISILIKSMLKTKDIFVDERLNMIVIRDTPEVVRIAEKLIAANDMADPEVMLDIEVLEVSRNRLQELGIVYPNQLSVVAASPLTLDALNKLKSDGYGVSPNPALNFKKTTAEVNLLSSPRIRVRNNEKAKILVGDRVPIITTTSTANVGISESVQYVDVGLKLDVEPRITLDDFVNIKVGLEVSSLGEKTKTNNGATVYTIGTRSANTVLRLKNGETQILAGLIQDDERKSASKLPALGDIPLIGRLFSNQEDKKSKTEIVLAITPRVIGNINQPQANIAEYWSGTENVITDNPQHIPAPTSGGPMSAQETLAEQIRVRQEQLNANSSEQPPSQSPEPPPATPTSSAPTSAPADAVPHGAAPSSSAPEPSFNEPVYQHGERR